MAGSRQLRPVRHTAALWKKRLGGNAGKRHRPLLAGLSGGAQAPASVPELYGYSDAEHDRAAGAGHAAVLPDAETGAGPVCAALRPVPTVHYARRDVAVAAIFYHAAGGACRHGRAALETAADENADGRGCVLPADGNGDQLL